MTRSRMHAQRPASPDLAPSKATDAISESAEADDSRRGVFARAELAPGTDGARFPSMARREVWLGGKSGSCHNKNHASRHALWVWLTQTPWHVPTALPNSPPDQNAHVAPLPRIGAELGPARRDACASPPGLRGYVMSEAKTGTSESGAGTSEPWVGGGDAAFIDLTRAGVG